MAQRREPSIGTLTDLDTSDENRLKQGTGNNGHRRKPWIALLWGILCSPIAFAYVGKLSYAAAMYLFISVLLALFGLAGWIQSVYGIGTLVGILICVNVWLTFWPWLRARKMRGQYQPKFYNRWYIYPIIALFFVVPFLYEIKHRELLFGFGLYRTPSGSMMPTIASGDYLVSDARSSAINSIKRGDVVVVHTKADPNVLIVRRIVGLPGEHITFTPDAAKVNGVPLKETYIQGSNVLPDKWMIFSDSTVESDHYFVLGDNRANSIDSRAEGTYPKSTIVGKVSTIWYSSDIFRIGNRNIPQ